MFRNEFGVPFVYLPPPIYVRIFFFFFFIGDGTGRDCDSPCSIAVVLKSLRVAYIIVSTAHFRCLGVNE